MQEAESTREIDHGESCVATPGSWLQRIAPIAACVALLLIGFRVVEVAPALAQQAPPHAVSEGARNTAAGKSWIERLAEWMLEANRTHQDLLGRLSQPVATSKAEPQVASPSPAPPTSAPLTSEPPTSEPSATPPTDVPEASGATRRLESAERPEALKKAVDALKAEEARRTTAEHEHDSKTARREAEAARRTEAENADETDSAEAARRAAVASREASEARRRNESARLLEEAHRAREASDTEAARLKREAEQRVRDAETRRQAEALAAAMAERIPSDAETRAVSARERSAAEALAAKTKRSRDTETRKTADAAARATSERQQAEAHQAREAEAAPQAKTQAAPKTSPPAIAPRAARGPNSTERRAISKTRSRSRGRSQRRHAHCRPCNRAGRTISPPGWYVVKRGDSLWSIASRHYHSGTKYRLIRRSNARRIPSARWLRPCQRIYLPRIPRR